LKVRIKRACNFFLIWSKSCREHCPGKLIGGRTKLRVEVSRTYEK